MNKQLRNFLIFVAVVIVVVAVTSALAIIFGPMVFQPPIPGIPA